MDKIFRNITTIPINLKNTLLNSKTHFKNSSFSLASSIYPFSNFFLILNDQLILKNYLQLIYNQSRKLCKELYATAYFSS